MSNSTSFFVIVIVVFFTGIYSSFAQFSNIPVQNIGGVKYYMHYVESGNTLYSIAKKYGMDVEEIIKANPEAKKGIKPDQLLKIPVSKTKKYSPASPQAVTKSGTILHTVRAGETLFSIGKQYNVKVKDILDINTAVKTKDIYQGQVLKIPSNSDADEKVITQQAVKQLQVTIPEGSYFIHTVETGESLYSLAEFFTVSLDSIKLFNPGLKGELKGGQKLHIPKPKRAMSNHDETAEEKIYSNIDRILSDTVHYEKRPSTFKEIYHVALLLPFYLPENDSLTIHSQFTSRGTQLYQESEVALRFYEGFKIAADSLVKLGMSLRLYSYDTANDSDKVKKILALPEMKTMDIIIGPLYLSAFEITAEYAKKHGIPVVCPLSTSGRMLLGNELVSKITSSVAIQTAWLARDITATYRSANLLLFSTNDKNDKRNANVFKKRNSELLNLDGRPLSDTIRDFYFDELTLEKLKILFSHMSPNVVVIPSHDQAFVTDLLTKLYTLSHEYEIVVFGIERWAGFDNLDIQYLHKLQVHLALSSFIDYTDSTVNRFIKYFRERYKTDPDKYAFAGFDAGYYYLSALKNYGTGFQYSLPDIKHTGLGTSFEFIKTGYESGYENKFVKIMKYEDFNLVKAR